MASQPHLSSPPTMPACTLTQSALLTLSPSLPWAPTCVLQQLAQRQKGAMDSLLCGCPRQSAHGLLKKAVVPLHPVAGLALLHQAKAGLQGAGQLALRMQAIRTSPERLGHFLSRQQWWLCDLAEW